MKRMLVLFMLVVTMTSPALALTPTHLWSGVFGDAPGYQFGMAVAIDLNGNAFFAGDFGGTVNFAGGASQNNLTSVSGLDMYLVKFDPLGNHLWSRRFGGNLDQHAVSLATDPSGNVYLGGHFAGTVNLGDNINITSAGLNDIFLAKYGPGGNLIWRAKRGDAQDQLLQSVATDAAGNVYFSGRFAGSLNLGGLTLVSAGSSDMYIAKYDAAGTHLWSKQFGDAGYQEVSSIAADPFGNVYLLGDFQGTIDFGTGNMTAIGTSDIGLAKFNASGSCQWSRQYGTVSSALPRSVATDADGNIFLGGLFVCCIDFGGGYLFENGGTYDIFIAKLDPAGTHMWSKDFGDNDWDELTAIATDAVGSVYLYGQFRGQLDFGGGALISTPGSFLEPFLARLDSDGTHQWSTFFPSPSVSANAMACGIGDVCVTGTFAVTIDCGGGVLTGAGNNDIYAARFSQFPQQPTISSIVDVGNDQGGKVWIELSRSGHDGHSSTPVDHYEIFRKQEPSTLARVVAAPGRVAIPGWDLVGSIPAHGEEEYLAIGPTLADSTIAQGQQYSTFFIRAVTSNPVVFFDSSPDSGYSLDNLAPGVPSNFVYQSGVLSWNPNNATDLDHFTVYGASTGSFASAVVIGYTVATSLNVSASPYAHYFVTATDFSGNESNPASLTGPTGAGGSPESCTLSISAYPNPFNPRTTIRYTVPSRGPVTIAVFDARGSRVAVLVEGVREAGAFTQSWSGQDDSGHAVGSGVYFARVTHTAGERSYKIVLLK